MTHCPDCGHEGCSPGCGDNARYGTCPNCGSSTVNGRCTDPDSCGHGWPVPARRNLYPTIGD